MEARKGLLKCCCCVDVVVVCVDVVVCAVVSWIGRNHSTYGLTIWLIPPM